MGRLLTVAALGCVSSFAWAPFTPEAQAADDTPDAIMKRAMARDGLGLEGGHATLTMTVTQEDGTSESRTFEV
ncbi:MAG: hypothetical protein ACMG6S_02595, partial [Byssovorax sp.]